MWESPGSERTWRVCREMGEGGSGLSGYRKGLGCIPSSGQQEKDHTASGRRRTCWGVVGGGIAKAQV